MEFASRSEVTVCLRALIVSIPTVRKTTLRFLEQVILETCGRQAQVKVFGSNLTGLLQPSSDIDAVVLNAKYDALKIVGQAMHRRANRGEVDQVVVIGRARVPLVKFVHVETGKQVDICFNQQSGLETGGEAKKMMEDMPMVRPLVLVLKYFMGQRKLNETYHGGIGSFLLQLMVVALVQKCGRESFKPGLMPTNLGYYLLEFFALYGRDLNYVEAGITLLGEEGGGFFNKRDVKWLKEDRPMLLSLQNPHDRLIDVGSNSFKVGTCRKVFQAAHARLLAAIARRSEGQPGSQGSLLAHVIHPDADLKVRKLPHKRFATRAYCEGRDQQSSEDEDEVDREILQSKLKEIMAKHQETVGSSKHKQGRTSRSQRPSSKRRKQSP
ncbi:unnamed protein product [Discosporangium mesarthrocarpum]